jgi:hypothetical protein
MSSHDPRYLYRGESERLFNAHEGLLIPKIPGKPFHDYARMGQPWTACGTGVQCGDGAANEIVRHEFAGKHKPLEDLGWNFGTSGVSTTPHYERARHYATHGGTASSGYIYKLDRDKLRDYGVVEYVVANVKPVESISFPEDEEVILVANDYGELPKEIVLSVERVDLSV